MNKTPVGSTPEIISKPGPVRTQCNSITFLNQGTATIALNSSIPVLPGAQYVEQGNEHDLYTEPFMLSAITAGTLQVLVIRKNFL